MCSGRFGRTKLGRGLVASAQNRKAALAAQNAQSAEPSAGAAPRQVGKFAARFVGARSTLLTGETSQAQIGGDQPTLLGG